MEGTPRGVSRLDEREVKHIHDLAVQEGAVALSPRDELRHRPTACREDFSVEEAVDDIAQAPSDDQPEGQTEA